MNSVIVIDVKFMDDSRTFAFRVSPESTVAEFKHMISVLLDIPVNQQILVHINRRLSDDQTIASYGLQDGHTVYLFHRIAPPTPPSPVGGSGTPATGSVQSRGFGGGSGEILINVQYSSTRFAIRARPEFTIRQIKRLITRNQNIPVNQQRLIFYGRYLQDDQTIGSYGVQDGFVIHLARSFPASTVPAAELYANQLNWMRRMGFLDTDRNLQALLATSGNVPAAVDRIMGNRFR